MSKVVNGVYGVFDPEGIKKAVNDYVSKKGISLKDFFATDLHLKTSKWWSKVCDLRYGEETELKTICRAVKYDFAKLNFRPGETNDRVEKARERARANHKKGKEPVQMELSLFMGTQETKAPEPKKEPKKDIQSMSDEELMDLINSISDEVLVKALGAERLRSLYYLSMYHMTKK